MILEVTANNFLVFSEPVRMTLSADERIKKFGASVHEENGFRALKAACVFGANNVGKTCLTAAISVVRDVLANESAEIAPNIYAHSATVTLGISFLHEGRAYKYEFAYDADNRAFVYERFSHLESGANACVEHEIFVRDTRNDRYFFRDNAEASAAIALVSSDNILIYTLRTDKFPELAEYRRVLRGFAATVEVLDMDELEPANTIEVLRRNDAVREKTAELLRLADLDIDGISSFFEVPSLASASSRGGSLRRFGRNSTGTRKLFAVASHIVNALVNGATVVVDELDSSLHFKLTRALAALFNNEKNANGQLIFTAHDATLMDCKRLFRRDQIWFTAKDSGGVYVYSLAELGGAEGEGADSDVFAKYSTGVLGALPDPNLISLLLDDESDEGDDE